MLAGIHGKNQEWHSEHSEKRLGWAGKATCCHAVKGPCFAMFSEGPCFAMCSGGWPVHKAII